MYKKLKIIDVYGREVLDSRGNPTVEATVVVQSDCGLTRACGNAIVPSGASTGQFEAVELRDMDERYNGKGVRTAVENINEVIFPKIKGMNALNQLQIDKAMIELDGSENKEKLGANAILAVSMACAKACAVALELPLFQYIGGIAGTKMPVPMMNILNGGAHASNNIDVQEFMILPVGACCLREGVRWCAEVYEALKKNLKNKGMLTAVGDEGGFAPNLKDEEEALDLIVESITDAGYKPGEDFMVSLDVAASEWKTHIRGHYKMPKKNKELKTEELILMWERICDNYPIYSIEDPLDEEDWEGWKRITEVLGSRIRLVGDDLFVTNTKRLSKGIKNKCANAILIKPNQIGTLSETIKAVGKAQRKGYVAIMSHRSGETEDTTISDLAVGLNTGFIKTGAPCRGERTAKYNRLIRIEEEIKADREKI